MTNLKFTKEKHYDKGYGWLINYTCGKWIITNVETCWMITYDNKDVLTTKTLREAKANIRVMVDFNEEMI